MDVKARYEQVAKTCAKNCEAIIRSWVGYENCQLQVLKLDWSPRRRSSRGGKYAYGFGINIAMFPLLRYYPGENNRIQEYPSFDADPVIGGFYSKNPELFVEMIVCHEMAHVAQFYSYLELKQLRGAPHGPDFKTPYAKLRTQLLNHKIELNK